MQTPAEKILIQLLHCSISVNQHHNPLPLILNIGAGKSISIENQLSELGSKYLCDRIDIDDCDVEYPTIRNAWKCSIQEMTPVKSGEYSIAFANYVLEHVTDLDKAIREIYRILRPSGLFFATIPNLSAPEFIFARNTPLWIHNIVRHAESWVTKYTWSNNEELIKRFEAYGFTMKNIFLWSFTEGYLYRNPILNRISRKYDRIISKSKFSQLKGNVCIIFRKGA